MGSRRRIRAGELRINVAPDGHRGQVYGYDRAMRELQRCAQCNASVHIHCTPRLHNHRRCHRCNMVWYCSKHCSILHVNIHAATCAYLPEKAARKETWFIDQTALYHWRPILPPGMFNPKAGDAVNVLLRLRTKLMIEIGCDGCKQQHKQCNSHCSGSATPTAPTSTQKEFKEKRLSTGLVLYSISAARVRFPGVWELTSTGGVNHNGYRSGQGVMTCTG